jgi:hypothetical protein
MPEEGPGGTFDHGMRTEIRTTTPDGIASVRTFQTGTLKGPFQIRVTAVKNQIRAGTVVSQYISDSVTARRTADPTSARGHGTRWLIIAAVAGAAAAGAFAGMRAGGNGGTSSPTVTAPQPPQIGTPSVIVGGPQ